MGNFFDLDGPIYRFGNAAADVILLGLIWLAFSLPLVTIGASTTALFYVTTRRMAGKGGSLLGDFWTGFRSNLGRATLLWLLWLVLFGFLAFNLTQIDALGAAGPILLPVYIVMMVELVFVAVYLFPLTARFEMRFGQTLKSAFFMANRHLLTTAGCLALGGLVLFAGEAFPPLWLVGMGIYAYGASFLLLKVFKKYRPDLDADPEDKGFRM